MSYLYVLRVAACKIKLNFGFTEALFDRIRFIYAKLCD